jgi:hypothetical protein
MQQIIDIYNNTKYKALFNKFTSNQEKHNSIIEDTFIMQKKSELRKATLISPKCRPDGVLPYFILTKDSLHFKKQKKFRILAIFVSYILSQKFVSKAPQHK